MCHTCNTTLRQSPGQKTHRYALYAEGDRLYDHKLFAKGGRELLAEVYFNECETALERRFKVAQQMQYYAIRKPRAKVPRAMVPPPASKRVLFAPVFTDEEADDSSEEDAPPAPPPSPVPPGPTPGHLRAQQWRAEAYAELDK